MKIRRFILKHMMLVTVIPAIAVWAVIVFIVKVDAYSAGFVGFVPVVIMFGTSFGVRKYNQFHMKKAESALCDECDPYPMLSEVNLYLECAGRRVNKTGLLISYGLLLYFIGDYKGAEDTFRSICSQDVTAAPSAKVSAYYNLAGVYSAMELPELAIENYDKALELFETVPEPFRGKLNLRGTTAGMVECYKGHNDAALGILGSIDATYRLLETSKKFALAKVHYIAGERETALSEFDWVAKNGGKLACAAESASIAASVRRTAEKE